MTQPAPSSPQRARRRTASSALKMAWTPPCPRPTPLPRRISSAWDHFSMTSATLRWLGVLSTPLRRRFCSIRGCSRDCWRVSQQQGWALQRAARCQTLNTRPRGRRPRLILVAFVGADKASRLLRTCHVLARAPFCPEHRTSNVHLFFVRESPVCCTSSANI